MSHPQLLLCYQFENLPRNARGMIILILLFFSWKDYKFMLFYGKQQYCLNIVCLGIKCHQMECLNFWSVRIGFQWPDYRLYFLSVERSGYFQFFSIEYRISVNALGFISISSLYQSNGFYYKKCLENFILMILNCSEA